jgi:hypothetical protein
MSRTDTAGRVERVVARCRAPRTAAAPLAELGPIIDTWGDWRGFWHIIACIVRHFRARRRRRWDDGH